MTKRMIILLLAIGIAGRSQAAKGVAEIKGTADNSPLGTVTLEDTADGLKINVQLAGVPPGPHAFHIHEFGSCLDMGKAAGSHYNPLSMPHGQVMKDGIHHAHAGDLGNITVAADGSATLEAVIRGISLTGSPYDVAGRAVVLHEKVDDFSQPAGNAGGRIGCGTIIITGH
jgi:Cu-Zn family superoxide dismutase